MAITLLVTPQNISEMTPLGGNIDIDKIKPVIYDVQTTVIEPLLGETLYNKIVLGVKDDDLTGSYFILYNDYLKPILRHQIFAEYAEIASYTIDNGGIFKHQPTDSQIVDKNEIAYLAQTQRTKAQMYVERCKEWLSKSNISEYTRCESNNIKLSGGWYL